ncbi:MAG TPA: TniB family NTP-binding protein [Brevundimonas sp.]|jgi:hypothetical protein|uniref:TniB family NTP-binding protein n=1 Tax=Brevundimonas sp. TaxID=1871086 RepID=UPI002E108599|nr:TniB family NTP-binding protein [Brevundimonas sp.]
MNLLHLDADVREIAVEGAATRIAFLAKSGFVAWPGLSGILDQADKFLLGDSSQELVQQAIISPPRCGVSSLLREIERRGMARSGLVRAAVLIDAPAKFEPVRVSHALCAALDAVGSPAPGAMRSEFKAVGALRDCNTRLIMVRKVDRLESRQQTRLALYLQTFCEKTRCHLLLTGGRHLKRSLSKEVELAARFSVIKVDPWTPNRGAVGTVVAALRRYPLRQPSPVTPAFMATLFGRTRGRPGAVFALLKAAAREAIESKRERIDDHLLASVEAPFLAEASLEDLADRSVDDAHA